MAKKETASPIEEPGAELFPPVGGYVDARSNKIEHNPKFTGIARSVECFENQGVAKNFRIMTLHIVDGKVTKIERSDPYAAFECIALLELKVQESVISLNNGWHHGKVWQK